MRHLKKKIAAAEGRLQTAGLSPNQSPIYKEETLETRPQEFRLKEEAHPIKQEEEEFRPFSRNKLKENINLLATEASQTKDKSDQDFSNDSSSEEYNSKPKSTKKGPVEPKGVKGATSAKNVIKNYGRALQNFAISNMSLPYICPLLDREKQTLKDFRKYFYSKKKQVRSIAGLRTLILVTPEDDHQIAAFKRVFQALAIIFIKFFSVNWIFSGKLMNKLAHLKCRFKMLRRIKSPENFTYLKGFL